VQQKTCVAGQWSRAKAQNECIKELKWADVYENSLSVWAYCKASIVAIFGLLRATIGFGWVSQRDKLYAPSQNIQCAVLGETVGCTLGFFWSWAVSYKNFEVEFLRNLLLVCS